VAYGDISNSHQGQLKHVGAGRFIVLVWPVWQVPISVWARRHEEHGAVGLH